MYLAVIESSPFAWEYRYIQILHLFTSRHVVCVTERRKLANLPEAVSADELRSLLILTRERFLARFDAVIPKTVLGQIDKIKTSNMLNGKFFISRLSGFLSVVSIMVISIITYWMY